MAAVQPRTSRSRAFRAIRAAALGCAVIALLVAFGYWVVPLLWPGRPAASEEEKEMRALIARLPKAREWAITFVDMILYMSERDQAVRGEVRAKGRKAIPYLIEGLHDPDEDVRFECAIMLSVIPTREGIEALVHCLVEKDRPVPEPVIVQRALSNLAGKGTAFDTDTSLLVDPTMAHLRKLWMPWWEANRNRIVETPGGLGIRQDDGTVTVISQKDADDAYYR